MPDTLTLEQLLTEWHLGADSIATNAVKALDDAGITPAAAAAMTPKELGEIRGLGVTRLERVQHQLSRIAAHTWHTEQLASIEAQKTKPGHCPECGGRRATAARNVVRDVWGQTRHVNPRIPLRLQPCTGCETVHQDLVAGRAAELAASAA